MFLTFSEPQTAPISGAQTLPFPADTVHPARCKQKNIRHATSFLRIPVSNRNDHKITDCKRQAAGQIGVWRLHIKSKTFSLEVADMKIAFYCRVDRQGFGFVLPDEADKLREFFAEH